MRTILDNIPKPALYILAFVAVAFIVGIAFEYWAAADGIGKLLPNGG